MGQVADDILNELMCQHCFCWMEDFVSAGMAVEEFKYPGYPRSCGDCRHLHEEEAEEQGGPAL